MLSRAAVRISKYIQHTGKKLTSQSHHKELLANATMSPNTARYASASGGPGGSLDLRGIYPPIATPFTEDEEIDYDKLKHNMDMWNAIPFRGYVVQGSNGEYIFLSHDERIQMIQTVKEMAGKDKLIIAGSGCESTRETIWMTDQMAQAGADAALVITPCYYKNRMTNQAMLKHYLAVADESTIPVLVYNVPGNTGIDLAPEVVAKLAEHPNIIGWKDSCGDITKMADVMFRTRDQDFQTLAGSASFVYPALSAGAVGGVCALANILGREVCQLQKLQEEGKQAEARDLQLRLIGPNTGVTKKFGVPGLKAAMEWHGFYGGPVRAPLLPLSEEEYKALRQMFQDSGFGTK